MGMTLLKTRGYLIVSYNLRMMGVCMCYSLDKATNGCMDVVLCCVVHEIERCA